MKKIIDLWHQMMRDEKESAEPVQTTAPEPTPIDHEALREAVARVTLRLNSCVAPNPRFTAVNTDDLRLLRDAVLTYLR